MFKVTDHAQTKWPDTARAVWLPLVLLLGFAARFGMGLFPTGYDFDSYRMVIDIVERGGNVYAETGRYNYGPIWFNLLHGLDLLACHHARTFRWLLIGLLSAADAGIFWVLWRKFGRVAATWFFLNPVSIMVTGWLNQFDNVAILLGLLAVVLWGDDPARPVNGRKLGGLGLLGLSLAAKHVFFVLPLWLALKQKGFGQKCLVLLAPVAIFLVCFAPWWAGGRAGIIGNVFLYKSEFTGYLFDLVLPPLLQLMLSPWQFWMLTLGLCGLFFRRQPALESLLLYTAVLVAASPATAVQYLAIPTAFTSVFVNYFTVAYTLTATIHCLHLLPLPVFQSPVFGDRVAGNPAVALLFLAAGVARVGWGKQMMILLRKCRLEVRHQFGFED